MHAERECCHQSDLGTEGRCTDTILFVAPVYLCWFELNNQEITVQAMGLKEPASTDFWGPFNLKKYKRILSLLARSLLWTSCCYCHNDSASQLLPLSSTDRLSNWHLIKLALIKYASIMVWLEMTKFVPFWGLGKEWNHRAMLKALTNRPCGWVSQPQQSLVCGLHRVIACWHSSNKKLC